MLGNFLLSLTCCLVGLICSLTPISSAASNNTTAGIVYVNSTSTTLRPSTNATRPPLAQVDSIGDATSLSWSQCFELTENFGINFRNRLYDYFQVSSLRTCRTLPIQVMRANLVSSRAFAGQLGYIYAGETVNYWCSRGQPKDGWICQYTCLADGSWGELGNCTRASLPLKTLATSTDGLNPAWDTCTYITDTLMTSSLKAIATQVGQTICRDLPEPYRVLKIVKQVNNRIYGFLNATITYWCQNGSNSGGWLCQFTCLPSGKWSMTANCTYYDVETIDVTTTMLGLQESKPLIRQLLPDMFYFDDKFVPYDQCNEMINAKFQYDIYSMSLFDKSQINQIGCQEIPWPMVASGQLATSKVIARQNGYIFNGDTVNYWCSNGQQTGGSVCQFMCTERGTWDFLNCTSASSISLKLLAIDDTTPKWDRCVLVNETMTIDVLSPIPNQCLMRPYPFGDSFVQASSTSSFPAYGMINASISYWCTRRNQKGGWLCNYTCLSNRSWSNPAKCMYSESPPHDENLVVQRETDILPWNWQKCEQLNATQPIDKCLWRNESDADSVPKHCFMETSPLIIKAPTVSMSSQYYRKLALPGASINFWCTRYEIRGGWVCQFTCLQDGTWSKPPQCSYTYAKPVDAAKTTDVTSNQTCPDDSLNGVVVVPVYPPITKTTTKPRILIHVSTFGNGDDGTSERDIAIGVTLGVAALAGIIAAIVLVAIRHNKAKQAATSPFIDESRRAPAKLIIDSQWPGGGDDRPSASAPNAQLAQPPSLYPFHKLGAGGKENEPEPWFRLPPLIKPGEKSAEPTPTGNNNNEIRVEVTEVVILAGGNNNDDDESSSADHHHNQKPVEASDSKQTKRLKDGVLSLVDVSLVVDANNADVVENSSIEVTTTTTIQPEGKQQ